MIRPLILSACLALFMAGCQNTTDNATEGKVTPGEVANPATAEGQTTQGPILTFEKEAHDFGKIMQGEKVSYNFKFRNTGNGNLLLTNASASCGCTVPEYTKEPVPPGGEGIVTVTFDSAGKEGKVSKTVTITANTVPNTKVLTISTEIEKPKQN